MDMDNIFGYVVGVLVVAGFGYFLYKKFTAPKNTATGHGGGSKDRKPKNEK